MNTAKKPILSGLWQKNGLGLVGVKTTFCGTIQTTFFEILVGHRSGPPLNA